MGYNYVVVVLADALGTIKTDSRFGETLAAACSSFARSVGNQAVSASGKNLTHANAATVIGREHADTVQLALVGGNTGQVLGSAHTGGRFREPDEELRVLQWALESRGYKITLPNVIEKIGSLDEGATELHERDTKASLVKRLEKTLDLLAEERQKNAELRADLELMTRDP